MTARKPREFFLIKKKLEEKICEVVYRASISLNQKIIANPYLILDSKSQKFALHSSASYITIKINRKEYSGILIPYDGIDMVIYQFNNLAS